MRLGLTLVLCLLVTEITPAPLFFDFFKNVFGGGNKNQNSYSSPNSINSGYRRPNNNNYNR